MNERRRTSLVALLALATAFAAVGVSINAPRAAAVVQVVQFDAGPQTGYQFSSTGTISATKTVTLAKPGSATYDSRAWITGRGVFFRLTSSVLAGYWVRESMVTYVPGMIVTKSFNPPAQVSFPAGTYLGYTFDADAGPPFHEAGNAQPFVKRIGVPTGGHRRPTVRPDRLRNLVGLLDAAHRADGAHRQPADLLGARQGCGRLDPGCSASSRAPPTRSP